MKFGIAAFVLALLTLGCVLAGIWVEDDRWLNTAGCLGVAAAVSGWLWLWVEES